MWMAKKRLILTTLMVRRFLLSGMLWLVNVKAHAAHYCRMASLVITTTRVLLLYPPSPTCAGWASTVISHKHSPERTRRRPRETTTKEGKKQKPKKLLTINSVRKHNIPGYVVMMFTQLLTYVRTGRSVPRAEKKKREKKAVSIDRMKTSLTSTKRAEPHAVYTYLYVCRGSTYHFCPNQKPLRRALFWGGQPPTWYRIVSCAHYPEEAH